MIDTETVTKRKRAARRPLIETQALATSLALIAGFVVAAPAANGQGVAPHAASAAPTAGNAEAEKEIRDADDAFVKAFNSGDAKAIAALFTEDAEAIDEYGAMVQGREAIEKVYESLFAVQKGAKIAIVIDSLRMIAPDTAIETGRSRLTVTEGAGAESSQFSAVLVKRDGRWLQTYVRELPEKLTLPKDRLKDLEWLLGEWVDESREAVVFSTCTWSKDEHFLLRDFTTQVGGKTEMTIHQRIGWDPMTHQIKSWVFDSEGGHSEGLWSRGENEWVVKSSGVLADGKLVSATHVYRFDQKHRIHFRSIDRTIGADALPDGDEVILVRKPPTPVQ